MKSLTKFAVLLLVTAMPALAQTVAWQIDPDHTNAQFSVRHMTVSNVRGEFTRVTGNVMWDDKDLSKSSVEATIDATTLNTRVAQRDAHLKSADFFDVANFPTITFRSTKIEAAGAGKLKVTGNLTIRGVTREVVLDVDGPTPPIKDPGGRARAGASASTKINRKDFGLKWNMVMETGGLVVGDDVNITIDLELVGKS